MKMKLLLSLVIASILGLTGCVHRTTKQQIVSEPALVTKPFVYNGRTWFDTNKAVLRPSGQQTLKTISRQLLTAVKNGEISSKNKVIIVGHTDSRASNAYNQKLSKRRAHTVAQYLKNVGIPSTIIVAFGRGETQPVASNATAAGMQKNRRVEIHVSGNAIRVVND
ncbi:MAG: OmpA family protein [Ostreibacterium sp.]